MPPVWKRPIFRNSAIAITLLIVFIGGLYLFLHRNQVSTDDAVVSAPEIALGPDQPGILRELYVTEGTRVMANQTVARVGDQLVKTNIAGVVIGVNNVIGKLFNPLFGVGDPIVTMIDPHDLRVLAKVDENKGLTKIRAGDRVDFTVDAFGSRKFEGEVESIIPSAVESQVVFDVSDKRETRKFTVKVKYDTELYPEILNGMSAKVTVYTQ